MKTTTMKKIANTEAQQGREIMQILFHLFHHFWISATVQFSDDSDNDRSNKKNKKKQQNKQKKGGKQQTKPEGKKTVLTIPPIDYIQ